MTMAAPTFNLKFPEALPLLYSGAICYGIARRDINQLRPHIFKVRLRVAGEFEANLEFMRDRDDTWKPWTEGFPAIMRYVFALSNEVL